MAWSKVIVVGMVTAGLLASCAGDDPAVMTNVRLIESTDPCAPASWCLVVEALVDGELDGIGSCTITGEGSVLARNDRLDLRPGGAVRWEIDLPRDDRPERGLESTAVSCEPVA